MARKITSRKRADRPPADAPDADGSGAYLTGQLLIAMPALRDGPFARSLIYLCAHTGDGAMGIVLNRPLSKPSFQDLLQQLDVSPSPPARQLRLCEGGPVDGARGFVLHTADWTGDGSLRVDSQTALTASLDVLQAVAMGNGPAMGLLALGYASWGPGQLDDELQRNAWLSAAPEPDLLFDSACDTKWTRALATLRVDPVKLSDTVGHA